MSVLPEGDQTGKGGDQSAGAADIDAHQKLGVIVCELAEQNGRGDIADELAGEYAEEQGALI